ncbi:MAG: hypothetical protein WEA08_06115, partial [Woeseia sp.]
MLMPLGYRWLIDRYHLPARPLAADACADTSVKGRETRRHGDLETHVFEAKYEPEPTLVAHLDTSQQFGPETGPRDSSYRVIDNVPGTRDFCPLVRRTEYL